jgi:hypothetical protein
MQTHLQLKDDADSADERCLPQAFRGKHRHVRWPPTAWTQARQSVGYRALTLRNSVLVRSRSHTCGGRQAALAYELWSGVCDTAARPRGHCVLVGVMP